ncbi:MAG: 4Fe-4S binding protein [Coriobacteriaceae bacterium]|uniref:4Fe-4S binding protein n=1 Tax=Tractidigestivibacter sp. TaxID=2847320 RepID=UPI002A838D2A|nr:4Fe-4S binding protein [Tractidigestivibacter sp.]MCI6274029.1 4Fe-4S binding protein [Coriobacteriaceae bacterium]MCI6548928.1 4Fe-4S binding protein [Coriobacteriaceae bacterium]MCI6843467.1 4Fe-4S binding protein [Coriobacteriaceae bacterium]MCI7438242.1 4Fe-4S binding protein [Coriobacteriaceae bacterium]MDD7583451.1 4Fe-4S binding protein [Coriobacteriaceae bacterium]
MARTRDMVAVVRCAGGPAPDRCPHGCIGCGLCVAACRTHAIELDENGVARVDRDACVGCGLCERMCEQHIIGMAPRRQRIQVLCSNREAGPAARARCQASCIACGACERSCTSGAVRVTDDLAVIDQQGCISCGMCAAKCPRGVIHDAFGIIAKGL